MLVIAALPCNPRRMITAALVVLTLTAPLAANTSKSVNDSVNGSELIADEVEDDAHDDAWRAGTSGAAIGGGVGAVAGLAVIGGYLLMTASGQRFEMPFGGYELFLAVPAATILAAAIGSVSETAIHGDASWTNAGIAGLGGAVAGVVGGVAAIGVGIGTAYVTSAALQAARTDASALENAAIGIVLGGAVGTATYLAAAAAIPAVAVEMFGE